jgi:hypothetical protein
MKNMFFNYDNNIDKDLHPEECLVMSQTNLENNSYPMIVTDINGKQLGLKIKHNQASILYFNLKDKGSMYLAENGLSLYDLISSSSINFEITTTTHKVVLSKTFLGSEVFDYLTNDLVIPLTIEDFKHLKKETYKLSLKLM